MIHKFRYAVGAALVAMLCACGGGGGGGSAGFAFLPPVAPPATGGPSGPSEPEIPTPADNAPPVAAAAKASAGTLGLVAMLDGSGSKAAQGRSLSYAWMLQSKPLGSQAVLADANGAKPSLLLDEQGDYVVRLVVNDGVKDSEPAYLTVTPAVPATTGPIYKFALIETTPTPDTDRRGQYAFCEFRRQEGRAQDFWPVGGDAIRYCSVLLPGMEQGAARGLGTISGIAPDRLPSFVHTSIGTPSLGAYPADTPAMPVGMSYDISPDVVRIARTPLGKSVGESLGFTLEGIRGAFGKGRYRIAGAVLAQNAPPGWDAAVEMTVRVRMAAYDRGTLVANFDIYSKRFTADFSDDVEFDLAASAYQVQAPGATQVVQSLEVTQQVAYSRKTP